MEKLVFNFFITFRICVDWGDREEECTHETQTFIHQWGAEGRYHVVFTVTTATQTMEGSRGVRVVKAVREENIESFGFKDTVQLLTAGSSQKVYFLTIFSRVYCILLYFVAFYCI